MIWVGLLVLTTTSLLAAQEGQPKGIICKCSPSFYCDRPWHTTVKCLHYTEVCCEQDPITNTTEAPLLPTSPTLTSAQETTQLEISNAVTCGVRNKPAVAVLKIDLPPEVEGGTRFGEFPWMAVIIRNTPEGQKYVCGGSVIHPNLILTAAHSIKDIPATDLLVKTGAWNITDLTEVFKHQDRKVLKVVLHDRFNSNIMSLANDFALLVLNQSLKFTENIAPVCLPSFSMPINESSCIATGWGADKYGKSNGDILKKVVLPLIDFDTCQRKMKVSLGSSFQLHDSFICAGNGYQGDTCVGDGGGPLMCATKDNPDKFVQIGITSWGVGCSSGVPGAYSSVKAATDWIEGQADIFHQLYEK